MYISLLSFGQRKDSIYLKSGEVLAVEKILDFGYTISHYIDSKAIYEDSILYNPLGYKSTIKKINYNDVLKMYSRYKDRNYIQEYKFYLNNYKSNIEEYKNRYYQYNINQYYKQSALAYGFFIGGSIITLIGYRLPIPNINAPNNYGINKVATIAVGGIFIGSGIVLKLDSYKYFKIARIGPTMTGVGVNIDF